MALLVEEMHRVLRFFNWKVQDWLVKGELNSWPGILSKTRAEGLRAYAHRQAALVTIFFHCSILVTIVPLELSFSL